MVCSQNLGGLMRALSIFGIAVLATTGLAGCASDPLDTATIQFQDSGLTALVGDSFAVAGEVVFEGEAKEPLTLLIEQSIDGGEFTALSTLELPAGQTSFNFDDEVEAEGDVQYRVTLQKGEDEEPYLHASETVKAMTLANYVAANLQTSVVAKPVKQEPSGEKTSIYVAGDAVEVETNIAWVVGTDLETKSKLELVEADSATELATPGVGAKTTEWKIASPATQMTEAKLVLTSEISAAGQKATVTAEYPVSYINLTTATNLFFTELESAVRSNMTDALALIAEHGSPVFVDENSDAWKKTLAKWKGQRIQADWGEATDRIEFFSYESPSPCAGGTAKGYSSDSARSFHIFRTENGGEQRTEGVLKDGKLLINMAGAFCQP